jgi:hypothetical protein
MPVETPTLNEQAAAAEDKDAAAIVTKCVRIVRKVRDLVQCGPKNALYRILRTMGRSVGYRV